jgi:hypothetical protein
MTDRSYEVTVAVFGKQPNEAGWIRVHCPFCEGRHGTTDKSVSFSLSVVSWWFECWRCGTKGKLPEGLSEYANFEPRTPTTQAQPIEQPEGFTPLGEGPGSTALVYSAARQYLYRRGVDRALMRELGIGACLTGKFGGRVIVPVRNDINAWVWFVARTWTNHPRRYLYPQGDRHGVMFNEAALSEDTDAPLLVVEGVFDAIPHLPDVVAVLGKPQERQLLTLSASKRPIVVCLDGDAWEEGWAVAKRLSLLGACATSLRLPPKTDPGNFDTDTLWAMTNDSN